MERGGPAASAGLLRARTCRLASVLGETGQDGGQADSQPKEPQKCGGNEEARDHEPQPSGAEARRGRVQEPIAVLTSGAPYLAERQEGAPDQRQERAESRQPHLRCDLEIGVMGDEIEIRAGRRVVRQLRLELANADAA